MRVEGIQTSPRLEWVGDMHRALLFPKSRGIAGVGYSELHHRIPLIFLP